MKKIALLLFVAGLTFSCTEKKEEKSTEEVVTEKTTETTYNYQSDQTSLTWTAYKMPEKVGVAGTFDSIKVTGNKASNVAEEVLAGAAFEIDGLSVNSKNEVRDPKLVEFFFKNLVSPSFNGKFGTFNNGTVDVTLNFNDVEKVIPFTYTLVENKLTIKGTIDMIEDFNATKAFDAIHEACKELHNDKTWPDVAIEVVAQL